MSCSIRTRASCLGEEAPADGDARFGARAGRTSGRLSGKLKAMFAEQPPSFREIRVAPALARFLHETGNVLRSFIDHRLIEIRVVALQPQGPAVFNRQALAASIELGEELRCVLSMFEVFRVESRPVVVGDETAVKMQMLIQALREVLEAQPVLEKAEPGLEHQRLRSRAHKL